MQVIFEGSRHPVKKQVSSHTKGFREAFAKVLIPLVQPDVQRDVEVRWVADHGIPRMPAPWDRRQ